MLGDTALPDRDFRMAVARQFDVVAERFEKVGETQQQQTIVLTEIQGALKTITEALREQKQDAKAAPGQIRDWLYLGIASCALAISLISLLASHVSLH